MQIFKSILFGALVLLFSATVVAQGQRGERRGFDLEKMTEQLDLTPEQATQLKTIHEEQRTAFAKLAEGLPEGERPDREQMRGLMQESRKKMMEVLTPDQQETLKAERQNRRAGEKGKRKPRMNEELRSELRAYRSEIITPKFIEVRTAFDAELSAAERAQITKLREAARTELGERGLQLLTENRTAHRGESDGMHREHKGNGKQDPQADHADKREERRTEMRAFMQKHKTDVQAVRDIARTHETELAAVRAELDAAKVQWKKDSDAIRAKHLTAEQLAQHKARDAKRKEMRQNRGGDNEGQRRGKPQGNDGAFSRADRGAFTFLLMDPTRIEAEGFEEINAEKLSVYPNPTTNQTTLKFEVRAAGPVRVELIDASGKVLETLLNATREANTYELQVVLPASLGKTGLLRVTDAKGVRTTQVTKG